MKKILLGALVLAGTLFTSCGNKQAETAAAPDSTAVDSTQVEEAFTRVNCFFTLNNDADAAKFEEMGKQLVEASQNDEGMIRYDLMKSVTDPKKYVMLETWSTDEALDKHSKSEHFTTLVPEMEKLAAVDMKQVRQPSQDNGKGWYMNITANTDAANLEKIIPMMKAVAQKSQAEEQNQGYDFFLSILDNTRVFLFEEWPSQEALDFHKSTDNFKNGFPPIKAMLTDYQRAKLYK